MGQSLEPQPNMFSLWILSLLGSLSSTPLSPEPLSQEQVPSWVNICGGRYLFSEDTKPWLEAEGQCELYSGHLLQINTREENFCLQEEFLRLWQPEVDISFWHSANDNTTEGVWRQWDGRMVPWTPYWSAATNEPNGGRSENCGGVSFGPGELAGKWWSHFCYEPYKYICEE